MIIDVELKKIENCRHFILTEKPINTVKFMMDFLEY